MRICALLVCILFSLGAFADSKGKLKWRNNPDKHFQPSVFEVVPLNSPVKDQFAKFSLKLPIGFEVDKIKVKLVNANDLKKDQKNFDDMNVVNNTELHVDVSKLPPGFYRLYVTVKDKKSKQEHSFQSKYHDFVRFVIDEALQVPMPDPKKNDATVGGVDSDNDGIRDDVQRWINETYSSQPNVKLAMKQYAVAFQQKLLTVDNKEQNIRMTYLAFEASDCLEGLIGLDPGFEAANKLMAKYLNTKERLVAKKKASLNFHGEGGLLSNNQLAFCQFGVE